MGLDLDARNLALRVHSGVGEPGSDHAHRFFAGQDLALLLLRVEALLLP